MLLRRLAASALGFALLYVLGGCGYFGGGTPPSLPTAPANGHDQPSPSVVPVGDPLYQGKLTNPAANPIGRKASVLEDPLVIPDCRLTVIHKQEVPSERDGVLLFIGTEIQPGEETPPDRLITVNLGGEEKQFRLLREGDTVAANQLLGQLDDRLSRDDYAIKLGKVKQAEADLVASEKTREEAKARYDTATKLESTASKAISKEDVRAARLAWDKYYYEAKSKVEAVHLANLEANQALTILKKHEIRAAIPGVIKKIYKKPGEAVKSAPSYEPLFQIINPTRLQVEGSVEVQELYRLRRGDKLVVETLLPQAPDQTLIGHLQEVTGVAVGKDAERPVIVSSSLDATVRVWDLAKRKERRVLDHPASVRAVACTPPGAARNLCLSGTADGVGRLWNLDDDSTQPLLELKGKHRGAILCCAFSPDGSVCATGGDDRDIHLWNVATGALMYKLAGHSGAVTSLAFTPSAQLVSAGRDNKLRLWTLGTQAGRLERTILGRSGDVTRLGVSPDGKYVLFDPWQSKDLRILSLPDGLTEGVLKQPSGASHFTTFALFSPCGRVLLTAGASEGKMQLWRVPSPSVRGAAISLLATVDRAPPTCAAFSPDGSFLVSGTRDRQVLVWDVLPCLHEMQQPPLTATIVNLEKTLDPSSNQVRVFAELDDNPGGKLLPGLTVTLVRYPSRAEANQRP
jgi:WD40 repeat protein